MVCIFFCFFKAMARKTILQKVFNTIIPGRCHAGLDPASSVFFWIALMVSADASLRVTTCPAFAGMTVLGYLLAGIIISQKTKFFTNF